MFRSPLQFSAFLCAGVLGISSLTYSQTASAFGFPSRIDIHTIQSEVQSQIAAGVAPEDIEISHIDSDVQVNIIQDPEATSANVVVSMDCELISVFPMDVHCTIIITITVPPTITPPPIILPEIPGGGDGGGELETS